MLRYGQGDATAFRELYGRHKDALYRYMLRGGGQAAAAAELAQDVWLRLIEARGRYRPQARFTTWLYTIAHHRLVDHWRGRGANPETLDRNDPAFELPDQAAGPEQNAADADCVRLLLGALAALPAEQREVILLREDGEHTLEEIAAIQGVGRETVKSRLRYALARLKESLGDCL